MSPASAASRAEAAHLVVAPARARTLDGEWAADQWRAARLGVPASGHAGRPASSTITQRLAARTGQALVPVPPGHRLRLRDYRRRRAGPCPLLPLLARSHPR